ncbi:MAG: hypothetical protein AAFU85_07855 [Planctomycetota bacterium]
MARRGSSYLEIQVAMVLLSVGMMGLFSLSVVHTKQAARLRQVLPPDQVASINPAVSGSEQETAWARKLGAIAEIEADAVAPRTLLYPLNLGFQVVADDEDGPSVFQRYDAPGGFPWFSYASLPDYNMDLSLLYLTGAHGSYAEWTVSLAPGEYEVLVFCPRNSFFGNAVPYEIYDGATQVDTVIVDQQTEEQDFSYNGKWWQRLGVYTFHQPTARVRILDTPVTGLYNCADAVMFRCRRSFDLVTEVSETGAGGAQVTVELN